MEHSEEKEPPTVLTSDTENATTIPVREAPADKQYKFRKFRAYNTDMWNGPKRENTEQLRRQDDLHRYDALASKVLINDRQRNRGRKILDGFDLHEFGGSIEEIIFGILVVVANADVRDGSRYYPNPHTPNDDEFEALGNSISLGKRKQASIIEKVADRVDITPTIKLAICPVEGCSKRVKTNGVQSHVRNVAGGGHGPQYELPEGVELP